MAVQLRRGNYADFDPQKMKPAEVAVVQEDDPTSHDGKAVYVAISPGDVKRMAVLDELQDEVYNQIDTAISTATQAAVATATQAAAESASEAAASADAAAESARTLTIDSTLTQTGQAADAKAAGDKIIGLKEDINDTNLAIDKYDLGKKRLAQTFEFGSLNTNGDIVDFVQDIRAVTVEYYSAASGDALLLDAGYSIILCEYNVDKSLSNRTVITFSAQSRKFDLAPGKLYRIAIWDSNATTQTSPYQYAYNAYIQTITRREITNVEETANRAVIALNQNQSTYTDANAINKSIIASDLESGGMTNVPNEYGTIFTINPKTVFGADTTIGAVQFWFSYEENSIISFRRNFNNVWTPWVEIPNKNAANLMLAALKDEIDESIDQKLDAVSPDVSMFETVGVIGDSFASGYMGVTHVNQYVQSWPQVMARKHGMMATNYSKDGQTARAWIRTPTRGLQAMLADAAKNLYIIALGLNDAYIYSQDATYLGSVSDMSDVDYDENPDTFFGNMGRIIKNIQAHAPKSKIILITSPYGSYNGNAGAVNRAVDNTINEAIEDIAAHYSLPLIITLSCPLFYSAEYKANILAYGSHPTATMYSAMANAYANLIGKVLLEYPGYFADYNNAALT